MRKNFKRIFSLVLAACLVVTVAIYEVSADTASDLQKDIALLQKESERLEAEISKLKKDKSNQSAVLAAVQKKIANTQAQISRCNQEINSINAKIAANQAEIDKTNSEIEDSKLKFKKRLRAIQMSNTGSNIQILLGADDFSNFLQLAQLTSSVSAHDRRMIEDMVAVIKALEAKNEENKRLLNDQIAVRETIVAAQKQLEAEEAEAQRIYNSIASDQSQAEKDNKAVEAAIKEKNAYLNTLLYGSSGNNFINSNVGFTWPVPSCQNITSYYGQRWGTMHNGIDISNGSIFGKPIVAITDGYVYRTYSACPHTSKASRCRCGSGWGNHVAIDHGSINGANIKAMYAHMNTIAVANGQFVKKGQVIGYVGTTGDSTGYHLHFGIMKNNAWVNPMSYFSKVK